MHLLHFYFFSFAGIEAVLIILVICALLFLFWNWLYKRNIKKYGSRKIPIWLAAIISTGLVYASIMALLFNSLSYTPPAKDFDKTQWMANKGERFRMAGDIVNSRMLIGKDSNTIYEMLGLADHTIPDHGQCTYEMGACPAGLGIVFHSLLLRSDSTGKVMSAEHIQIKD
jgi:hypothetical protein